MNESTFNFTTRIKSIGLPGGAASEYHPWGATWGQVQGYMEARQYVHYTEHYKEQVLFGGQQRGKARAREAVAPCHPASAAHEACTVHHAPTEHAQSFEEIMTKSNVANEFMKYEVSSELLEWPLIACI
jgi:hypothetical protein